MARYHEGAAERSPEANLARTALLVGIASHAGYWMSAHDDKSGRWPAVEELQSQALSLLEASRVKPLSGRDASPGEKFRRAASLVSGRAVSGYNAAIPMRKFPYFREAWSDHHEATSVAVEAFDHWLKLYRHPDATDENLFLKDTAPSFWDWWVKVGRPRTKDVLYLSAEELEAYRVDVSAAGLSWRCGAGPLHSTGLQRIGEENDVFIFVISPGQALHANQGIGSKFHHSSFLRGGPVLGAGQMVVDYARIRMVSNSSGHATPDEARHFNTLLFLKRSGVDLSSFESVVYGPGPKRSATAQQHYDELAPVWGVRVRMAPVEKLELSRQLPPDAKRRFLRSRQLTEAQYVASLEALLPGRTGAAAAASASEPSASTGSTGSLEPAAGEAEAASVFGAPAASSDSLTSGVPDVEAAALWLFGRPAGSTDDVDYAPPR